MARFMAGTSALLCGEARGGAATLAVDFPSFARSVVIWLVSCSLARPLLLLRNFLIWAGVDALDGGRLLPSPPVALLSLVLGLERISGSYPKNSASRVLGLKVVCVTAGRFVPSAARTKVLDKFLGFM